MNDIDLSTIPLFSGLDRINLAKLLPNLERMEFRAGDTIFRQGDQGDCLYILVQGSVRVYISSKITGDREIAVLREGECIGEVALLTGEPRSAHVEALTDLIVLRLHKHRFDELLRQHHVLALYFAGQTASRLAAANAAQIEEKAHQEEETLLMSADEEPPPDDAAADKKGSFTWKRLRRRKAFSIAATAMVCGTLAFFLTGTSLSREHIILMEMLVAASVLWSLNAFNYNAVSLALPVAAVLFGVSGADKAFSGFASPSWFLVLAVFALSAAISRTGLMYRMVLTMIRRFPPSYAGQTLALACAGLVLTPVIPSSNNRAALAGVMALNICDTLGIKRQSRASIGMAMSVLLGFGHMSFLFMNGAAVCFFVLGLLPPASTETITWSVWLKIAMPLGLLFFTLSYLAVILLYRPGIMNELRSAVIEAQISTLGPMTTQEKLSLATVLISLIGFITQPWHAIHNAWIAMFCFLILYAGAVLDEKTVRSEINWNQLISFGSLVGFNSVMTSSGLADVFAGQLHPYFAFMADTPVVFLASFSLCVHLLRFLLPVQAALLVGILAVLPIIPALGIHPFIVGLVALISCNPWLLPYQNSHYRSILLTSEEKLFTHRQTITLAVLHIVIVLLSIAVSVVYWQQTGFIG